MAVFCKAMAFGLLLPLLGLSLLGSSATGQGNIKVHFTLNTTKHKYAGLDDDAIKYFPLIYASILLDTTRFVCFVALKEGGGDFRLPNNVLQLFYIISLIKGN